MASSNGLDLLPKGKPRRSTRIFQMVPVTVSSLTGQTNSFRESTSTLAMNCHGCLYPSQHEHKAGSWIVLEIPVPQDGNSSQSVRAQVKCVRTSLNADRPYLVGVELQTPTNVWGVSSPPKDWLQFAVAPTAPATPSAAAAVQSSASTQADTNGAVFESTGKPKEGSAASSVMIQPSDASTSPAVRVVPEEIRRTFDAKLQQAAEKAVSLALNSQVKMAIAAAVKTIETYSQTSVRDAERKLSSHQEQLAASGREQLKVSMAEAQEIVARLEQTSSEVHLILAEATDFLQDTAQRLGKQFSDELKESANRAAASFGENTSRFSEQYIARFAKEVQATTEPPLGRLQGKIAEAGAQLEQLNRLAAQTRTECETLRQASREELANARDEAVNQFRQRMETIWNSSRVAAMSAVSEHTKSLMDALSSETAGTPVSSGKE
jgi:hypothetical protein